MYMYAYIYIYIYICLILYIHVVRMELQNVGFRIIGWSLTSSSICLILFSWKSEGGRAWVRGFGMHFEHFAISMEKSVAHEHYDASLPEACWNAKEQFSMRIASTLQHRNSRCHAESLHLEMHSHLLHPSNCWVHHKLI